MTADFLVNVFDCFFDGTDLMTLMFGSQDALRTDFKTFAVEAIVH